MTRQQAKVCEFVRAFILKNGFSPTTREIAAGIGISSVGSAQRHVQNLVRLGMLKVRKGEHRSVTLARPLHAITVDLPVELDFRVRALAEQAGVTPEAIVIEAVRDGCSRLVRFPVSHETPSPPKLGRSGSPVRSSLG